LSDFVETFERPNDKFGRFLEKLAIALAVAGGLILIFVVALNFISIIGRYFFGSPLLGDFELVEVGCAAAVASFFPLCHLRSGNVIVDFVTQNFSTRTNLALDAFSSLVFGCVAAFIFWRMVYGAEDMLKYAETTMLLQFPVWIAFVPVVVSFGVLTVTCFYTFVIQTMKTLGRA